MRVVDGTPQRKNNWQVDRGAYHLVSQSEMTLDRRPPGDGFRHLLTIQQLRDFIELLPDWDMVAVGLDAIVLDSGGEDMGWHTSGVVAISAWERDLWWHNCDPAFNHEHMDILDRLEVERIRRGDHDEVRWTEAQARAFQLLHVLPHELGHHHDRMTTRSRKEPSRGEPYAEEYACQVLDAVWDSYIVGFGL